MTAFTSLFDDPLTGAILAFGIGLGLGYLHFASLKRVTALYVSGKSIWAAVALQAVRLAVLGAGLYGLALLGAIPLLAGALGVLLARQLATRAVRKGAP
ncbi:ATP synthase subunit I [Psychromarinibacter sp. S121]|uniref:N-ATPase subunit AtpR n=1 Tax=Psychromarinibacter sp. S121 TaxID=3415127 RepID=UPI003C7DDB02